MNFSVLDWNIQGKKYYTRTDFKKIKPELDKSEADIFCFQEGQEVVDKIKSLNKQANFNCVFSPADADGTNVILSRFPIISSGTIFIPEMLNKFSGKVLWAEIKIGDKIIKIYNCHFGITGLGPRERVISLKYILADANKSSVPTIICGDLNTTIPAAGLKRKIIQWFNSETDASLETGGGDSRQDERYYILNLAQQEKFYDVTDISRATWVITRLHWEIFKLKLDWFFVRDVATSEVILNRYVSDHRSIFVRCSIN